eukprot:1400399-Pyramimonas_sp.AAC.1
MDFGTGNHRRVRHERRRDSAKSLLAPGGPSAATSVWGTADAAAETMELFCECVTGQKGADIARLRRHCTRLVATLTREKTSTVTADLSYSQVRQRVARMESMHN